MIGVIGVTLDLPPDRPDRRPDQLRLQLRWLEHRLDGSAIFHIARFHRARSHRARFHRARFHRARFHRAVVSGASPGCGGFVIVYFGRKLWKKQEEMKVETGVRRA